MTSKADQGEPKNPSLLEKRLGYVFKERAFLELALTHPSTTIEEFTDNERLEFLGDSVLSLATSEHLYRTMPRSAEGELTRIKSSVVSTLALARISRKIKLGEFMHIGKGLGNRTKLPDSVHANVTEAVFAAVYLDGGYLAAFDVIVRLLKPEIRTVTAAAGSENAKSQLQEIAQKELGCSPHYRLISESGPQHGKTFVISVELNGRRFPEVSGHTKKEAEQGAARQAIEELHAEKQKPRRKQQKDKKTATKSAAAAGKTTRRAGRRVKAKKEAKEAKATVAKSSPKTTRRKAATPKKSPAKAKSATTRKRRRKPRARKNPYDILGTE